MQQLILGIYNAINRVIEPYFNTTFLSFTHLQRRGEYVLHNRPCKCPLTLPYTFTSFQSLNSSPLPTRGRACLAPQLLPVEADAAADQVPTFAQGLGREFQRHLRKGRAGMSPVLYKVAGDKGISKLKSKQQSPCSNCMHRPVTSWGNACSTCMHCPVTSQGDACTYCMGSKASSLSRIYLYSSYFVFYTIWTINI